MIFRHSIGVKQFGSGGMFGQPDVVPNYLQWLSSVDVN